jgi:hypothetical protein
VRFHVVGTGGARGRTLWQAFRFCEEGELALVLLLVRVLTGVLVLALVLVLVLVPRTR